MMRRFPRFCVSICFGLVLASGELGFHAPLFAQQSQLQPPSEKPAFSSKLRECIYKAEVHERQVESLRELKLMLRETQLQPERSQIITAMSIVKHGLPRIELDFESDKPLASLREPQAILVCADFAYLMIQDKWLELGDWIGTYAIEEISLTQLTLRHEDGHKREISLPVAPMWEDQAPPTTGAFIMNAPLTLLLGFAARQEGLNFFIPSDLKTIITGFYPIPDWLTFLDGICHGTNVRWTRHLDNIVFRLAGSGNNNKGRIARIDQRNQNLGSFLSSLAEQFSMVLVLTDPTIADVALDLHLQELPWDEVLDCLAIMNGLNWTLERRPGEKTRLYIQRE